MSTKQREYYTTEQRRLNPQGQVISEWAWIGLYSYVRGLDLGGEWDDPESLKDYLKLYAGESSASLFDTYRYEYRIVKVRVEVEEYWQFR